MDKKIDYVKINAGAYMHLNEKKITPTGIKYNPQFVERAQDFTKYFQEIFQDKIIEQIGEDGWVVFMLQVSQEENSWFVDIYVDDKKHFSIIVEMINISIPKDFKLGYWYKGNIDDYIQNQ